MWSVSYQYAIDGQKRCAIKDLVNVRLLRQVLAQRLFQNWMLIVAAYIVMLLNGVVVVISPELHKLNRGVLKLFKNWQGMNKWCEFSWMHQRTKARYRTSRIRIPFEGWTSFSACSATAIISPCLVQARVRRPTWIFGYFARGFVDRLRLAQHVSVLAKAKYKCHINHVESPH